MRSKYDTLLQCTNHAKCNNTRCQWIKPNLTASYKKGFTFECYVGKTSVTLAKPSKDSKTMRTEPTKAEKIKALRESIKHWEEDYPKGCDFNTEKFKKGYEPESEKCSLCHLHNEWHNLRGDTPRTYDSKNKCGVCPLIDKDGEGCTHNSLWSKANNAVYQGDKPKFMQARREMLDRMLRALRQVQGESEPEPELPWWMENICPTGKKLGKIYRAQGTMSHIVCAVNVGLREYRFVSAEGTYAIRREDIRTMQYLAASWKEYYANQSKFPVPEELLKEIRTEGAASEDACAKYDRKVDELVQYIRDNA